MENLDRVFTRLKEKGLKAKPSKCVLFRSPIDFLGHMVSVDGIQPQPDKLKAIRDWPTPHCLRDVRAFYGLASYYRKFVKDFAKIAEPLSRMTKKNTAFMWTMRHNSRSKIARGPCWMSIPLRIRPQGFHAFWTLTPQMSQSERCSVSWSTESKSQLPTSPAFSTAHTETTASRGENFSRSSHHSNASDITCWATKSSSGRTITVSSGSGLSNDLKESWQDGSKHWQSLISRLNIAQDVFTPMPMLSLDKTANSVGDRSPPTTGLTNAKERINSSNHCLFTRFSCAPSFQTMPLPSYKQKIQRLEKPTK